MHRKGRFNMGIRMKVLLVCALVCVATLSGAFFFLERRQEAFYLDSMRMQARSLFKQIVITRKWIADHGGIFVEQLPWVSANPYLDNEQITDVTGRKFVKENPAMVTRQLSEYAREQGSYWFHITSLRLVNPSNAPDDFETEALRDFERRGAEEAWGVYPIEGRMYFRYIAPLYVEASCLECHLRHGYRPGDIRGAISVAIPLDTFYSSVKRERITAAAFTVSVALVLMLGLYAALDRVLVLPLRRLRDFSLGWRERTGGVPPPESVTGDELDELYDELSSLHGMVTAHQRELEHRVHEATEELSRTNEKLARARDLHREISMKKSRFIAGLSHELRTPLTSVKGAVSYISERLASEGPASGRGPDEELASFIDIINRNINRFVKLVEDTLDLEKIESGHMELHFLDVDLGALFREVSEEFLPLAQEAGVGIEVSTGDSLIVRADRDRLRQVVDNLLLNAVRYSPPGTSVTLEGYRSGGWMFVWVKDRGPGLSPGEQEKVFEGFYKGPKGGTGLGLAISKGIVESHGGEIGVHSEVSRGASFYFKLPVGAGEMES